MRGAKVELLDDCVSSVRILVVPERSSADTVRDVRRAARSHLGRELDGDSVEILRAGDDSMLRGRTRRRLYSLSTERSGLGFTARVALELGGDVLIGEGHGQAGRSSELRAVARATLDACRELLVSPVDVEHVQIVDVGGLSYSLVALNSGRDLLAGAAAVKCDEHDSVARATLDAVNRVLGEVNAMGEPTLR